LAVELERLGADIEQALRSRAVKWPSETPVLRHGNTNVVF
jgi:formyltetrahydrofolate deformylase